MSADHTAQSDRSASEQGKDQPGSDDAVAGHERVEIFDTTLRDGEQSPGISLNTQEKVEIANQLARLGVDVIEAGFPITSPGDFEAVQAIARTVHGPVICGLARTQVGDIDAWLMEHLTHGRIRRSGRLLLVGCTRADLRAVARSRGAVSERRIAESRVSAIGSASG